MEPATSANDPYGDFPWADTLAPEAPEHRLYGLLPCAYQCEAGWMPLLTGDYLACPECAQC
jgi:hypothetical protein